MSSVQFEVSYQFGEYRQFAIEHGGHRAGKPFGVLGRAFLTVVAFPVFLVKASKVGRCTFNIDVAGIVRSSNGRDLTIPWGKVTAVHRCTPGLLIEKSGGALAISDRCFTAPQREPLGAPVENWGKKGEVYKNVRGDREPQFPPPASRC